MLFCLTSVNFSLKSISFCKLFCRKSCEFNFFAIPLQTLSRTNETSSKTSYGCVKKALNKERVL